MLLRSAGAAGGLDRRGEMWLAEADDFGQMLMAERKPPWSKSISVCWGYCVAVNVVVVKE